MSERDERLYLAEILAGIDRILAYTTDGAEAFRADTKTQEPSFATSRSSVRP